MKLTQVQMSDESEDNEIDIQVQMSDENEDNEIDIQVPNVRRE